MRTTNDSVHVDKGEMSERIRLFDWSKTTLGPIESWSPALRMMTNFLLANRFPLTIGFCAAASPPVRDVDQSTVFSHICSQLPWRALLCRNEPPGLITLIQPGRQK